MAPRLLAEHGLPEAELNLLEDRLNSDNRRATDRDDDRALTYVIRDETSAAIGIASGYSWAGIAELNLMWVDESCRGRGHGKDLLDAFVAGAASRGARRVWVSTHDFQAPGLYEKAGFRRIAELIGWPKAIPTSSCARR
jgi:ribosomal protein S18 acetylase RimI-like enzyme